MKEQLLSRSLLCLAFLSCMLVGSRGVQPVAAAPWTSAGAESLNVSIIGSYPVESATGIWSCAAFVHPNGQEYGLIGADSLHVVDLRDPTAPRRAAVIPPATPVDTEPYYVDVAVRGPYVYAAARNGPILILDLSNPFLPIERGRIPSEEFCACSCGHPCTDPDAAVIETLFIDDQGILYVTGIQCGEGFHMYDLAADPISPPWLCHAHTSPGPGHSFYSHYVFAQDSLIVSSCSRWAGENRPRWDLLDGSLRCPDFPGSCGDGEHPPLISSFTHDGEDLHAHSAWLLDDPDYLLTCDEKKDGHVRIWDISDLQSPHQVGSYQPDLTCHSVHEAVVKGRLGYAAWYNKGIQVFDLEDPTWPIQVGSYEHPVRWRAEGYRCCDPTDGFLANCVGVPMIDPFFPSGIFIAVEVDGGLLVGRFELGPVSNEPVVVIEPEPGETQRLRVLREPTDRAVRILWRPGNRVAPGASVPMLEVFSASGALVAEVVPMVAGSAGAIEYRWNGSDRTGRPVPSGVYFVHLRGRRASGKVVILD